MRRVLMLMLGMLCTIISLFAQERFPADGVLYNGNVVSRIDIAIDPDSLAIILEPGNEESDHEFPAVFTFTSGAYTQTIDSVGFRLRGNTSRYSGKKSFKVSLNTFIRGQQFAGVEKINLNGEHNDPSIARARTCWHLFRKAGVPGSRSAHVELYINGEYRGLYLNVEHIDEEFVDLRFGNNDGNMYKCLWPADLAYLGDDPDLYRYEHNGRRAYELKRNEEQDDYSDLAEFIRILNLADPDDFQEVLEPVFNVNIYLKNLAIEILSGHWDAYSFNKNNYYLYNNESTGRFEFIPYDPDNTLGISWWDVDWTTENIYAWYTEDEARPLTRRLLENQVYRDRFSFYMDRYLDDFFSSSYLDPYVDGIRTQISTYVDDDVYRTYDYGFSTADFTQSYDQAWGAHVREGIKPYIGKRHASARDQLQVNEVDPIITLLYMNAPSFYENLVMRVLIEDEALPLETRVWYAVNNGEYASLDLVSTGADEYLATLPGLGSSGTIDFYFEATDQQQRTSRDPFTGHYTYVYGDGMATLSINNEQEEINLYPVPASKYVYVGLPHSFENGQYAIYSTTGKVISGGRLSPGKGDTRIDLTDVQEAGMYVLEVIPENGRHVRKKFLVSR